MFHSEYLASYQNTPGINLGYFFCVHSCYAEEVFERLSTKLGLYKVAYLARDVRTHSQYYLGGFFFLLLLGAVIIQAYLLQRRLQLTADANRSLQQEVALLSAELSETGSTLDALQARDEYQINTSLEATISAIEQTYTDSVAVYEGLLDLQEDEALPPELEESWAEVLVLLADRNYASASAQLQDITQEVTAIRTKLAQAAAAPAPQVTTTSNEPPGAGFSRQRVSTDVGDFVVDLIAGDLSSTRVIVDTAADSDCGNDCPVLPLATYVQRNGGYAGINGSYFCPASYPSCADKKNSYDTLAMNSKKTYFNSDNNVYSSVPAVIFGDGFVRFVGRSSDWGRDTSVNGVLANQPLLVSGGNVVFGGDGDPKKGSKGTRSFVAHKGSTVYIGVVYSATVAESARVLKALGMDSALNLDSGGSTALYYNGYKAGPGRNIPNAIVFVRK